MAGLGPPTGAVGGFKRPQRGQRPGWGLSGRLSATGVAGGAPFAHVTEGSIGL